MASGGAFHRAYTHATQQAFLEAHELAFRYFGGVFRLLRYDNLSSAVKKILRGHRREETSRFIAFRSHWRYQSEFCNPARGNEKGGVEGEGGYFRRNHWVPVPEARSLDELNGYLERCSNEDRRRILSGRTETVGSAMLNEQPHLLPLATESFDLAEISFPTVDSLRCVRVRTNRYSVPLPPGAKVEARVHAAAVELCHGGKRVAWHDRCYSRQQKILDLEHYLDVLRKKPGALAGSTPLAQWRQAGRWPASFDQLWHALNLRHGRSDGTRQMIELLELGAGHGWDPVLTSIPLHLAFIRRRKDKQKLHFAQVIRLVKWWVRLQKNKDAEFKLKSFMTEMIVAHLADGGIGMADYTIALEKVFSAAINSGETR